MVIDSHLHLEIDGDHDQAVRSLCHELDLVGIDRCCLMPRVWRTGAFMSTDDLVEIAGRVSRIVADVPGRFYPLIWLNPILPHSFIERYVHEHVLDGPFAGVKLSVQMNATDPRLEPMFELLSEHDVPVLFHSWYKTVDRILFESTPADIAQLARAFPRMRILLAHITGARIRGIDDVAPFPNLYFDTSGSQPEDGYLRHAVDTLGAERVLFGSDYPGRDIAVQLARIDSIDLTETERQAILWRNAVRFYEGRTPDA